MPLNEIRESHTKFRGAWRFFSERSAAGKVLESPEVFIASSNVAWALLNAAFLPAPVETGEALERAVTAAARHFQPDGRAWMMMLCEDELAPSLRPQVPQLLGAHGLTQAMVLTGMVAERLLPPTRPLPPLEFHRVTDAERAQHVADINAHSYGVPLEMGREALRVPRLFEGEGLGMVGLEAGRAVACTAVFRVQDVAYVALVATLPEHRRKGVAEAVMRHALDEARRLWGVERTVLHSTEAGFPVYLRMGYRPATRFHGYLALPPTNR
jgi:GNAT superfamily N-acetyltransferase